MGVTAGGFSYKIEKKLHETHCFWENESTFDKIWAKDKWFF